MGGGDFEQRQIVIEQPAETTSWTEISGVCIAGIGLIVTIVLALRKRSK